MNRHENMHGIFPTLASTFGGCGEQKFDDLLGKWLCPAERKSGKKWSEREELALGRGLDPDAVAHKRA
jgi:hypothetical protein